ncbi:MAG: quinone-dependent dihydroorotate dehydrogenase [Bdellovibrionales bacterium]|nr:quinone-dependent dihydroorotate dehydrogenase [Bdellovibrionales bacterium]
MGVKPWLWLSPALAHKLSPTVLKSLSLFSPDKPPEWQPLEWRGLHFPNRLGVAGGVDKDARNIKSWWALGAGFLEIGTITPQPQPGNTPPVLGRDVSQEALWNRLGFPSQGVGRIKKRLVEMKRPFLTPVFANIGKNAATPLESAAEDYVELLNQLRGTVDGFVVNISSPNTKGLRDLLKPERLQEFLRPILQKKSEPILLKLSPDMEDEELERVLTISHDLGIDGWILTNTSQGIRDNLRFPKEGGVSGRPLAGRSKALLQRTLRLLGPRRQGRLIVSVGGVMSAEDVQERLALGADLVQVYSALIFEGPYFFRKVANQCLPAKPMA